MLLFLVSLPAWDRGRPARPIRREKMAWNRLRVLRVLSEAGERIFSGIGFEC